MIFEYLKLSINELINNKLRSFLSLIGIVIGVAVVFIIFSISDITNAAIINEISGTNGVLNIYYVKDKEDTSDIFMKSYGASRPDEKVGKYHYYPEDVEVLKEIEGISDSIANYTVSESVKVGRKSIYADIQKYTENYMDYYEFTVASGHDLGEYSKEERINLVMVNKNFVEYYLDMSLSDVVGETLRIKDRIFTIVGVMDTASLNSGATLVLPQEAYDLMYSRSSLKNISVKIEPGQDLRGNAQQAVIKLNQIRGYEDTKDGYVLEDLSFIINQVKVVTGILSLVMGVIASISLLVAGIGVMNIMLVSVVERTREIGVKRAIGASKSAIQFQFMVESCLLTFTGGVIGVLIGIGIVNVTLIALDMNMPINMNYVAFALLFSISLGILFGYLPSKRAANLNIIEAIQSE